MHELDDVVVQRLLASDQRYTPARRAALVFDGDHTRTQAHDDPRRAFREYWSTRL